ncbi:MAG: hypothetical protein Q9228_006792 [Teloschistes exilis]
MDDANETEKRNRHTDDDDERIRHDTYHGTSAIYMLPNDKIEHARLEDQALGYKELMHGRSIHAPLQHQSLQHVIEVGCGTSFISRQLAVTYPAAQVYGIDLSPVPPFPNPSNLEFILGDVRTLLNTDPRLAAGSADFIFNRFLVLGITDWPGYVRDMATVLRPGGWLEIQDHALVWYRYGSHVVSENWAWMRALSLAAEKQGLDLQCGKNMRGYMEGAGFKDVQVWEYRVPVGDWMARMEGKEETLRLGEHTAREPRSVYWHAIARMLRGMEYTEADIEGFKKMCRQDLTEQEGLERRFYVTVGRKPFAE